MNHVHLDFLNYTNNTIDDLVRVDIFATHHRCLQSFSGDFVRTFKFFHSLDYTIQPAAVHDLIVLGSEALESILFDLLRQGSQLFDLLLHINPFGLLLHDLVIASFDVIDLLKDIAQVIPIDCFREDVGLEVLHSLHYV